jgi:hypothetical protein
LYVISQNITDNKNNSVCPSLHHTLIPKKLLTKNTSNAHRHPFLLGTWLRVFFPPVPCAFIAYCFTCVHVFNMLHLKLKSTHFVNMAIQIIYLEFLSFSHIFEICSETVLKQNLIETDFAAYLVYYNIHYKWQSRSSFMMTK